MQRRLYRVLTKPRVQPRYERTREEVAELKALRRAEIERRCMLLNSPITSGVLAHMLSFQAAIQIIQPLDDRVWEVLKPRLLSQREEAEQRENDRIAQTRVVQETFKERRFQNMQAKSDSRPLRNQGNLFNSTRGSPLGTGSVPPVNNDIPGISRQHLPDFDAANTVAAGKRMDWSSQYQHPRQVRTRNPRKHQNVEDLVANDLRMENVRQSEPKRRRFLHGNSGSTWEAEPATATNSWPATSLQHSEIWSSQPTSSTPEPSSRLADQRESVETQSHGIGLLNERPTEKMGKSDSRRFRDVVIKSASSPQQESRRNSSLSKASHPQSGQADSNPTSHGINPQLHPNILSFSAITGTNLKDAEHFLSKANNDVRAAVEMYYTDESVEG